MTLRFHLPKWVEGKFNTGAENDTEIHMELIGYIDRTSGTDTTPPIGLVFSQIRSQSEF